ncbi:MAG: LemA family protein [Synergistaceae bacterium]|nr:LemA family protein [Synergistaceae bacterium]
MNNIFLIAAGVAVAVILYGIALYNGLIRRKNRVAEAWSDIETLMKRRYDLIPNLVETVKGYAKHESETLEKVIQARNSAMGGASTPGAMAQNENLLTGTLKSIFALAESYPELKANENFRSLQAELTDTEDKIQASRRFYNSMVLDFNNRTELFPSGLIASMFGFKKREFFELGESERADVSRPVKVQF